MMAAQRLELFPIEYVASISNAACVFYLLQCLRMRIYENNLPNSKQMDGRRNDDMARVKLTFHGHCAHRHCHSHL